MSDPMLPQWFFAGQPVAVPPLDPALYVVATPIGNLEDITLRALNTLGAADMIACEDTRTTRVLLQRYQINRQLVAYHEHNANEMRPKLLAHVQAGKSLALVSDAGTPLVSDPGFRLVGDFIEAGLRVVPLPGPSAPLAALVGSGLPSDSFTFAGFLPSKSGDRRARISDYARSPATVIFFETPHRIAEALDDLMAVLGPNRRVVIARELTKFYEDFRRGSLAELVLSVASDPPRGEIVLLIGPAAEEADAAADIDAMILDALKVKPLAKAASDISKMTGVPKKDVYARALELTGRNND